MDITPVHQLFEIQAGKSPEAIAIEFGEVKFTYQALDSKANQVANGLIGQGVKPGDFVGLCMDRSPALIASIFGVLKTGAVYVPLDPEYPRERLLYMIEDSGIRVLLLDSAAQSCLKDDLSQHSVSALDIDKAFAGLSDAKPDVEALADPLVYMIYTSGSTGKPKGSLVYHRGFSNLVDWYVSELALGAETRVLHMTSPAFDLTQKNVFAPLVSGGCLCLLDQRFYDASVIVDHIENHRINVVNCTPSAFSRLLSFGDEVLFERLKTLRYVVLGGEPILMSRLINWLSSPLCQAQIINSYGPTECTDVVCAYRVATPSDFIDRNVPIGSALPGFELRIVTEDLQRLPQGESGQIAIAGIGVGAGYYKKPEMTAKVFVDDPEKPGEKMYLTGDSGRVLDDGSIDYHGRIDNQVKIRGFRIELGEIERTLESHEAIKEAACSTYKDLSGDNKLSAFLVYQNPASAPANSEVRRFLQQTLPDFMMPTAWVALDKLPLTPNGKLDRKSLPEPVAKRPTLDVPFVAPNSEVQKFVEGLWLELLGLDRVGIDDRFFELGGSSLNAVDFIARLSSEIGERIAIASFFHTPTIRGFEKTLWTDHADAMVRKFPNSQSPNSHGANDEFASESLSDAELDYKPRASGEHEDIAIIGMAGRFPGAEDVDDLWEKLIQGEEAVRFATDAELREAGVSEEDIADPDYVRAYFSMDDVEYFDAEFFGYTPREVVAMDPQHRLFLELAWSCLDNAGYAKAKDYPGKIGVFGGIARDAYLVNFIAKHPDFKDELHDFSVNMGNDKNFPASRVSYKLDLKGPAINIQTACSSSGVALHVACQSLLSGDSDMALVGGCRVLVPTKSGYRYVEGSALSRDGHIYAFDKRGTGMVRGSGGAFVLIKRLSDAVRDGDSIRAVIKSTAINNDGSDKIGYTAPSVEGQSRVINQALRMAGVEADTISYVETHGTATALGDPIETRALTRAYRQHTKAQQFCRIGSIKTNIGHLDAGAAVAGIVKVVKAMEQGILPASINYEGANPDINFESSPFEVNAKQSVWKARSDVPLRAGVSSFGLGGTNFHAILEATPFQDFSPQGSQERLEDVVLAVSAKSESALQLNMAALKKYIARQAGGRFSLLNFSYSLNCFRPQYAYRAVIILERSASVADAVASARFIRSPEALESALQTIQLSHSPHGDVARWLAGENIDWRSHYASLPVAKVPLPPFKFDRRRFWADLPKRGARLVLLGNSDSAQQAQSLDQWCQFLDKHPGYELSELSLAALPEGDARCAVLAVDNAQLSAGLRASLKRAANHAPDVVMMFPGGGAQYVNMGKGLYERFAVIRDTLDHGFSLHYLNTGIDLKSIWFASDSKKEWARQEMLRPSIQLPALCMFEYALFRLWESWGIKPKALVGHSAGENVAACVAGVMSFEECLKLMTLRGELFERVENSGMLSVSLPADDVKAYLGDDLDLATINAPGQSTVAGHYDALATLKDMLERDGVDCQIVPINIAAHSRLLDPILQDFENFAATLKLKAPSIPFVSNLTGTWITDELATDPAYFAKHLRNTVRFADNIRCLNELAQPVFLECGPGKILSSLVNMQVGEGVPVIPSIRHAQEQILDTDFSLSAIGLLWSAGAKLDWAALQREIPGSVFVLAQQAPNMAVDSAEEIKAAIPAGKQYESRIEYINDTVCAILQELSGIPATSLAQDASFLELGFDSLFLTQANLRFKKAFAAKVSLRTLFKDAPSIRSLASFIDEQLPAGALSLEMSGQVNAAAGTGSAASAQPTASEQKKSSSKISSSQVVAGPFRALQINMSSELSDEQKQYVEDFKTRYIAKTQKSQAFNEEHRAHYADPRTVMGFKQAWKDLTYTLVGERSKDSRVIDIDGNEYVDCMNGFGAIFFGHNPDFVRKAVMAQMEKTLDYGPQSQLAGPTAKMICELTGMDRASFCNTGSEAVLAAIRISRTVTGNDLIVTFAGDYHGIFDEVLVKTQGGKNMPVAPGIPESSNQHVLVLEYGEPESIEIIRQRAHEIAAVIVEPVQSRRPELQPKAFLKDLRKVTADTEIPLIFDEMITGFRLHQKGAQGWFDVDVDIACYGKVIGGGYPVGVIAGKSKYMDALDGGEWHFGDSSFPEVGVTYFAGTFIRHPIAIAAVNAVAKFLLEAGPQLQQQVNSRSALFAERVNRAYRKRGIPVLLTYFGSVYFPRFYGNPEFEGFYAHHLRHFGAHHIWGGRPGFLTMAHTDEDIDFLVDAFIKAGEAMQSGGFLPRFKEVQAQYPWTDQQEELWLAYKVSDEAALAYNEQVVFEIDAVLNPAVLELALDTVINRHESLKSVVAPDESGLIVKSYMKPQLAICELDGSEALDEEIHHILQEQIDTMFDLFNGPLIKTVLIQIDKTRTVLGVCASHLIIDGWSLEKVMGEICGYYTTITQGRYFEAADLPTMSAYFDDLATRREQGDIRSAESFWLSRYDTIPPVMELPRDYRRPSLRTYNGERFEVKLEGAWLNDLRAVASQSGSTTFGVLLSAFYLLLNRLSGEDDLVVGIPAAGQPHTGLTKLCAHMVSFLPVRVRANPEESFVSFLHKVNDEFLEAKEHQDVGYGGLLKVLKLPRDPGRMPLLATCFNMDMPYNEIRFDGHPARFKMTPRGHVKYELYFNVTDMGDHLSLEVDYNSDLYRKDSVEKWVELYQSTLEAIANDANADVNRISGAMSQTQLGLLRNWNNTYRDYNLDQCTLDGLVSKACDRFAQQTAVRFIDRTLSFSELERQASRLAQVLVDEGVGFEQPVALMMNRSEKLPVVLLAIQKAGGAYLPLDPDHPHDRLAFIVEESGAALVIADDDLLSKLSGIGKVLSTGECWDRLNSVGGGIDKSRSHPNSLAYILYTSGSTGKPKGVMIEHRAICNRILWMQDDFNLDTTDRVLQKTPYTFDVSVWEFFLPLITGAELVMAEPEQHRDTAYLVNVIQQQQISLMHFVPSMLTLFLADDSVSACSSLKRVVCSGEALGKEQVNTFYQRLPNTELHNYYGPTEAAVDVSAWLCEKDDAVRDYVPIGRTVANTQLHIVDRFFNPVPLGTAGELCIGGVQLARGYVNRPDLTDERFVRDPFSADPQAKMYRTGDLARFHDDGVIEYLGRNDFQVKIRGLRIELGEIENVLSMQPAVSQAVVAAKLLNDDPALVAYIVRENNSATREELRQALQQQLPDYMVPHHFVFLDAMPLTSSGKADRKALLAMELESFRREETVGELPETEGQIYLAAQWQAETGIDEIYLGDNFFDIGGHSLLAAKVATRIKQERGIEIPLKAFITSTLGKVAEQYLDQSKVAERFEPTESQVELPVQTVQAKKSWLSKLLERE
jgi:amino acid adenylation domain-containing protein